MRRVLLCLATCLLVATGCDHSATSRPPPRPPRIEDLAQAPVDLTKRCPKPAEDMSPLAVGTLPAGAVVVRLCNGWQSPYADGLTPTIAAPLDALTQGADQFARYVNTLDPMGPMPSGSSCAGVGGPTVDVWFGYPQGRAVSGRWDVGGCDGMRFGSQKGRGLEETPALFTRFAKMLAAQRTHIHDRPNLRPPRCNPSLQPVSPFGYETLPPLGVVTYCRIDARGRWRAAAVPAALVRQINRDATPHRRVPRCTKLAGVWFRARTIFGDRVDLSGAYCQWTLPNSLARITRRNAEWQPSPALLRALEQLPLGPPHWQRRPDGTIVR